MQLYMSFFETGGKQDYRIWVGTILFRMEFKYVAYIGGNKTDKIFEERCPQTSLNRRNKHFQFRSAPLSVIPCYIFTNWEKKDPFYLDTSSGQMHNFAAQSTKKLLKNKIKGFSAHLLLLRFLPCDSLKTLVLQQTIIVQCGESLSSLWERWTSCIVSVTACGT